MEASEVGEATSKPCWPALVGRGSGENILVRRSEESLGGGGRCSSIFDTHTRPSHPLLGEGSKRLLIGRGKEGSTGLGRSADPLPAKSWSWK